MNIQKKTLSVDMDLFYNEFVSYSISTTKGNKNT